MSPSLTAEMSTHPDAHRSGPAEPEWGRSTELLPPELANLTAFESVFPHWNNGDIDRMLEHYCDDIVWRNVAMGTEYHGKQAVRDFLEQLYTGLPDLSLDVTLRVPRGRYVAEEYVIRGHHRGVLFGLPPTGRYLEIPAASMVELRDGKLKEDHFYFDAAGAMRQMGLMPGFDAAVTPWGAAALRIAVRRAAIGRALLGASLVAAATRRARRGGGPQLPPPLTHLP
jgi:steroid delta-isomerase-like uncharacterized protein